MFHGCLLSGFWIGFAATGFFGGGCQTPSTQVISSSTQQGFTIRRVNILGLTDFSVSPQEPEKSRIKTFVELLDDYHSPLKKLCVFRFEFYEYTPLTANPRGKRLMIWPDIDLTDPDKNNQHWKDYLRSYEFYLPLDFSPQPGQIYLLEVTCMTGGQRFGGILKIRYQP